MKKKISLAGITCIISLCAFNQTVSFPFAPEMDSIGFKGKPASWSTRVNAGENQTHALISFADRDRVFYYLVDSSLKIIDQYAVVKDSMVANYYGNKYEIVLQTSVNNLFRNYIRRKNGSEIFVETPDFEKKTSEIHRLIDYSGKEKFITAFEDNKHVYFLTLLSNAHKLRVYTDSGNQAKEIELEIYPDLQNFNLDEYLKDVKIIKNSKEPDLYTCKSQDKLYIMGDGKILLTLDNNYQYSIVYEINLSNYSSELKMFRKNFFYCNSMDNESAIQTNSYVYQDKILVGVFCYKDLLLQLKKMDNDSLIMEFHAARDSVVGFSSSGLIKRETGKQTLMGPLWLKKTESTHEQSQKDLRTKDFFKAVNKSSLSFLITSMPDVLVMKIGEAHDYQTGGGGGGMHFTPGGSVGTPGGMVSMPGYWSSMPGGYASKYGQAETYFKTILNKETLEFIPEKNISTKYDKVDDAEDQLSDSMFARTAFDFNGKTYLFYWDKVQKKFMIEEVE